MSDHMVAPSWARVMGVTSETRYPATTSTVQLATPRRPSPDSSQSAAVASATVPNDVTATQDPSTVCMPCWPGMVTRYGTSAAPESAQYPAPFIAVATTAASSPERQIDLTLMTAAASDRRANVFTVPPRH